MSAFLFWLFLGLVMVMEVCSMGAVLWIVAGGREVWEGGGTEVITGT